MRDRLEPSQIMQYNADGFLVFDDFLSAEELDSLRRAVMDAVAERGRDRLPPEPGRYRTPAAPAHIDASGQDRRVARARLVSALKKSRRSWVRVLSQHINLWQTNAAVREFCLDVRLGRLAAELGGVDGVRLWHDQTMTKPRWGEPTGWHTDTPSFSFTHPSACTFWFALVDTDLRNGCMQYVAGSHHARITTASSMRFDGLGSLHPDWEDAVPAVCPVSAGSMIVHNGDTAHGAGPNMTPWPRDAFAITWMPIGATFNGTQNILPAELAETLPIGAELDRDDLFPVVYGREDTSVTGR